MIQAIDVVAEIEKALGAHEKAARYLRQPTPPQRRGDGRLVMLAIEDVIPVAAAQIEAAKIRNPFQQRRFARAVLTHDDRDWPLEIELQLAALECRNCERKLIRLHALRDEGEPLQERRRQVRFDGTAAHRLQTIKCSNRRLSR